MAEMLGPWLADWIAQSRDAAIAQGVQPIPAAVRQALTGYVPDEILERVRWRAGPAGELTVQQRVFQFDHAPAVTLDFVIVFASAAGATDAKLWAHEIRHVMQFADWGVREFAVRYLTNHAAVEREASEFRWEWLKATGRAPQPAGVEAP